MMPSPRNPDRRPLQRNARFLSKWVKEGPFRPHLLQILYMSPNLRMTGKKSVLIESVELIHAHDDDRQWCPRDYLQRNRERV
jgi:hypothetical protein